MVAYFVEKNFSVFGSLPNTCRDSGKQIKEIFFGGKGRVIWPDSFNSSDLSIRLWYKKIHFFVSVVNARVNF